MRRIGPGGYVVAVHALLTRWLADAPLPPSLRRRVEELHDALDTEPEPVEDAHALLLAAAILVERADDLAEETLKCGGEFTSRLDFDELHAAMEVSDAE